jgi:3-oxoacyl-[acyl-carrier-protein] synthase-3
MMNQIALTVASNGDNGCTPAPHHLYPESSSGCEVRHKITGVAAKTGQAMSIQEWADQIPAPNRYSENSLSGAEIEKILGVRSKSWEPKLFRDVRQVLLVARQALASAGLTGRDLDAVMVVTCTPYEIMLDQDSFRWMAELGVPDHVPPLQLSAGCAGMARAMAMASRLQADRILVITYNLASCFVWNDGPNPNYLRNVLHPTGQSLWASAALFSDAIAAAVLTRLDAGTGDRIYYSRDSQSFGDEPGVRDPLVYYPGGGALHPPGHPGSEERCCFGMNGAEVKRYYAKGMLLNHEAQLAADPGYIDRVRRIYTHQASPELVQSFLKTAGLPAEKAPGNSASLGNLVTPCTLKLLYDDLCAGNIDRGDAVCFSVVGAGPERGTFIAEVNVPNFPESHARSVQRDPALALA